MKTAEYFFFKLPLKLCFIITFILMFIFSEIFSFIIFWKILPIGFFFGMCLITSSLTTTLIWLTRHAQEFYKECDELDKRLDDAKTVDELEEVWFDIVEHSKSVSHVAMQSRIKELVVKYKTKKQYI